jgi:Spy/CpxP family protein refolding chaperone
MNRWWTFAVAALLVTAAPTTRVAMAQQPPAPEPEGTELDAGPGDEEGAGFEDGLALDVEPAQLRGGGIRRPTVGNRDLRDRRAGRAQGMRELAKELNLTATQRDRLEDVRDQHRRKAIAMRADLEVAMLDMRKLVRADQPDRRAIDAQIDRTSAMRAELQKARMAALLDARAILTPQQREKLRELRGSRSLMGGVGHRDMPGRRHGGGL